MFVKRLAFVVLIVAVLSSLVDTAVAQSEPQQFVVYVEFKPAGRDVFQQLDAHAEGSAGKHRLNAWCFRNFPSRRRES
jgi:hypothetical protein